ncbi:MAG TPA: ABC transporter permease, partial [Bacteroidales bacterium]|nr:ABC transporter permease [Bacteroidales bacterium]
MKRYLYNLNSAVEAVFNNKFRSVLTALGIIFGVAAVIAMMAIGNGARQEILEQIKMVGVNNIVITPKIEDKEKQQQSDDTEVASQIHKKSSPGLTLADATSIREIVPGVQKVSPEVVYNTFVVKSGVRGNARFSGIEPDFFEVYNLELFEGKMFSNWQLENAAPVCIIGPDIR